MASRDDIVIEITPQVLLKAYACGIFPMAESADDPALYWIEPQQRGILLLDRVHVPKRLARTVRQGAYDIRIDSDFDGVIDGCAEPQAGRQRTWINERIRTLYKKLHERRHCHSLEVYLDGELVGGLYGVALGRMFFGESMFSRATDASKVALARLVEFLTRRAFPLIDCQMYTPLLESLGAREIPRAEFLRALGSLVNYPEPPMKWNTTTQGTA
ncbi:MAG: leucyl/phenylalanyl-tRNA--protein transferase [Gammaproteobacteria bacterium]